MGSNKIVRTEFMQQLWNFKYDDLDAVRLDPRETNEEHNNNPIIIFCLYTKLGFTNRAFLMFVLQLSPTTIRERPTLSLEVVEFIFEENGTD